MAVHSDTVVVATRDEVTAVAADGGGVLLGNADGVLSRVEANAADW